MAKKRCSSPTCQGKRSQTEGRGRTLGAPVKLLPRVVWLDGCFSQRCHGWRDPRAAPGAAPSAHSRHLWRV
jgi:hypothetical protein